jgi:hypothetical protein
LATDVIQSRSIRRQRKIEIILGITVIGCGLDRPGIAYGINQVKSQLTVFICSPMLVANGLYTIPETILKLLEILSKKEECYVLGPGF